MIIIIIQNLTIKEKIGKVCVEIYGAANVEYDDLADEQIERYEKFKFEKRKQLIT